MSNEVQRVLEYACDLLTENGHADRIGLLRGRFRKCNSLKDADQVCHVVFGACNLNWPGSGVVGNVHERNLGKE